ncbi:T9SS type A sorting domain-containing protein [bacterium]|nr:T9SS type A sorting domain-containing protein [bacterium]MBU1936755.1 T9SS type A sorting domain-containing protein [bacterium]
MMRRFCTILALFLIVGTSFSQTDWIRWGTAPVLPTGNSGQWDDYRCIPGSIVANDSGYTMYYTGTHDFSNIPLGVATSPDGYTWTRYPSNPIPNPVGWTPYAPYCPHVMPDMGSQGWVMFGMRIEAGPFYDVCRAVSEDGIQWYMDPMTPVLEADSSGAWDNSDIYTPSVFEWQDTLWMIYSAYNNTEGVTGIGLAFSLDRGITWTRDEANPILVPTQSSAWDHYILDARVAPWNDTLFVMTYSGVSRLQSFPSIGIATSSDLRHWVRAPNNPVLWRGGPSSWDNCFVYQPVLANIDSENVIFYSGVNYSDNAAIGLVVQPASAAPDNLTQWIPLQIRLSSFPNPFNATTTIMFTLPQAAQVELSVYNILGRRVAVLQNGWLPSGESTILWNAETQASGAYYIQLDAHGQQVTRPMMLVK